MNNFANRRFTLNFFYFGMYFFYIGAPITVTTSVNGTSNGTASTGTTLQEDEQYSEMIELDEIEVDEDPIDSKLDIKDDANAAKENMPESQVQPNGNNKIVVGNIPFTNQQNPNNIIQRPFQPNPQYPNYPFNPNQQINPNYPINSQYQIQPNYQINPNFAYNGYPNAFPGATFGGPVPTQFGPPNYYAQPSFPTRVQPGKQPVTEKPDDDDDNDEGVEEEEDEEVEDSAEDVKEMNSLNTIQATTSQPINYQNIPSINFGNKFQSGQQPQFNYFNPNQYYAANGNGVNGIPPQFAPQNVPFNQFNPYGNQFNNPNFNGFPNQPNPNVINKQNFISGPNQKPHENIQNTFYNPYGAYNSYKQFNAPNQNIKSNAKKQQAIKVVKTGAKTSANKDSDDKKDQNGQKIETDV